MKLTCLYKEIMVSWAYLSFLIFTWFLMAALLLFSSNTIGIDFKPNGVGLFFGFFFISAWFFIPMAVAHFLGNQMNEIFSWMLEEKKKEGLEVFK